MSDRKRTGRWSVKNDRELIELAKSQSPEAIADKIQRSPATVLEKAARLGLSIKRKAKGK
jgi:DNA-binding CsgD family transcriptional regulator